MTLLSASILLFLVLDPFGNIPFFMCVLEGCTDKQRRIIIIRELVIALIVLVLFLFAGPFILAALQISESSLRISGGIILFLIAIKMIFGSAKNIFTDNPDGEPLIVPLAIPSIAGPSAIATVLLLTAQQPEQWPQWLLALLIAWLLTGVILLMSVNFERFLGNKGLNALQRLMGLILTTIAVEMFIQGGRQAFA